VISVFNAIHCGAHSNVTEQSSRSLNVESNATSAGSARLTEHLKNLRFAFSSTRFFPVHRTAKVSEEGQIGTCLYTGTTFSPVHQPREPQCTALRTDGPHDDADSIKQIHTDHKCRLSNVQHERSDSDANSNRGFSSYDSYLNLRPIWLPVS